MKRKYTYFLLIFAVFFFISATTVDGKKTKVLVKTGASQTHLYLSKLKGKNVALVANQSSVIKKKGYKNKFTHLVDSLLSLNIKVKKVFSPEHGFRGEADAGEHTKNEIDKKTGIPIVSLYGKNKKPTALQLKNIDVVVFDIQDVGVRFYTYISTLHYVMEACAEKKIPVLVLDRPNPNAHYLDGPVLKPKYKSFIGMHQVPVVYAMTIGEYAKMINGESWLKNKVKCNLTIIPLANYTHKTKYSLPIKPSPNLPNDVAINLYPSLCFFEGTNVSCGRGTNMQFQVYGSPYLNKSKFNFIPKPNRGSKYPKHQNKICYGADLRKSLHLNQINLNWLIKTYKETSRVKVKFWNKNLFDKLAGTDLLRKQIEQGLSENKIKQSWQQDLNKFKKIRKKYLLYQ